MTRPFRFGLQASFIDNPTDLRATARRAEDAGYSIVTMADHLGVADPFVACTVVAEATSTIRVGTNVLNIDFHPAALLARAAASIDLMSGGRFELGLGTGYAVDEYRAANIDFDEPMRRIVRVSETIDILRGLFAGDEVDHHGVERRVASHRLEPLPPQSRGLPILVGGNGDKLLEVAATQADIVGFTGFGHRREGEGLVLSHMTADGLDDRVTHVGSFGSDVELQALVQQVVITNEPMAEAAAIADSLPGLDAKAVLDSPFYLIGTKGSMADALVERRRRHGISYWVFFADRASPEIDEVVGELAGR